MVTMVKTNSSSPPSCACPATFIHSHQFEHSLTDTNTDERLFLTPDRRAGIAIRIESHGYLLNERWVKT
ncbi:unnamed protein product [Rotaria socialis]|uniref:Uncharacterized protein n=1 Tax=Rotaria socialis TaxID=392032 RepID=A0A818AAI0_9BILA|nr:unnamed protein product [Rotaria socialis]